MPFEGHEMTFTLKIKNADIVVLQEYDILSIFIGSMTNFTLKTCNLQPIPF